MIRSLALLLALLCLAACDGEARDGAEAGIVARARGAGSCSTTPPTARS